MNERLPLKIVMYSAEMFPYVKVGGLADVVGALPKALERLGARVSVMIPAYQAIPHIPYDIRPCEAVPEFDVPMGLSFARAEVFQTRIPDTSIDVYLIGCPTFFLRDGVYDDPASGEGFADNMQRFIFFMKAGLATLEKLGEPADVIHCHDSHAALIPAMLRTSLDGDSFFARTGTLFTIHNLAYQATYGPEALYWAGVDGRHFYPFSPLEFWGRVNFMKAAIGYSDLISTVSETYAREIQSHPEYGHGLEAVLRSRSDDLTGIVNGIDYVEWNPETDPLLPARYSSRDLSGKALCKAALLKEFGLPEPRQGTPLVGIVSRLADQKGFDLIAEALDEIASLDLQMVILGTGQRRYHDLFTRIVRRHPQKFAARLIFDNRLAHLTEAGSDMFLMPSRYEPCGLNQLYSLRYGTVPIVRETGGLADTVSNYDLYTDNGTGFTFKNYSADEMMIAIKRALMVYSDPERWRALMRRDMAQDWSWERSALRYAELYRRIYRRRNSSVSTPAPGA